MYTIDNKNYPCCTTVTMRFIGGKWKSVILYHLVDDAKRYNELRKLIPTITERTLSLQLKQQKSLHGKAAINGRIFINGIWKNINSCIERNSKMERRSSAKLIQSRGYKPSYW